MDNQRLIVWGAFIMLAYLTWQTWQQQYGPQPIPGQPAVETAEPGLPELGDTGGDLPEIATDGELPTIGSTPAPDVAAPEPAAELPLIRVRTDVLDITINPRGGVLQAASVRNYPIEKDKPDQLIELLNPGPADMSVIRSWLRAEGGQAAPGADAVFEASGDEFTLGDETTLEVPLRWSDPSGVTVEKVFTFTRGRYDIRLTHTVENGTEAAWVGDQVTQAVRRQNERERSMFNVDSYSFDGPEVFDGDKTEKLDLGDLEDGPFSVTTDDGWYASLQHHFLSAIVPVGDAINIIQVRHANGRSTASVIEAKRAIAPGQQAVFERMLFVGPKLQEQLKDLHPRLKLTVDYGWLTVLSNPMFLLLSFIYGFVGNWGWAIIGVTIIIKLIFYPLSQSSGRSMAKMRELQPRLKALQDRYKDDRQALSQAMMDLYKREKVNPAAGCLPILIQMPFFLAFYWVLVESVEMRQAPFMLWITDLSVRDPFFILPIIMGAAMIFQQRLNPAPTDPVQAKVMQIMPIMFTGMFAFFPSGLVLYWVTNTLLSIAQQWHINKVVHQEATERKKRKKKGKKNKGGEDD